MNSLNFTLFLLVISSLLFFFFSSFFFFTEIHVLGHIRGIHYTSSCNLIPCMKRLCCIFLPFVPFLNWQNYVFKAIEKNVARYEPENLRLLHLFQVFKPKKTEFRDRKIVLNTDRYLSIEQSLSGSLYLEKELVCIPRK